MNARRFLTLAAAILITAGQALIFAADTAASAPGAEPTLATLVHSSVESSMV